MVERITNLIKRHNDAVEAMVRMRNREGVTDIWVNLVCEGFEIALLAVENGIDVTCDTRTGEVICRWD